MIDEDGQEDLLDIEASIDQRAREKMFRRALGMSQQGRTQMQEHHGSKGDWWGTCKGCGVERRGTMSQLTGPCPHCGMGPHEARQ